MLPGLRVIAADDVVDALESACGSHRSRGGSWVSPALRRRVGTSLDA